MKGRYGWLFFLLVFGTVIASGCRPQQVEAMPVAGSSKQLVQVTPMAGPSEAISSTPIEFMLQTNVVDGRMVYVGVGGDIDGVVNPDLVVQPGLSVRVTLLNGDGIPHDLYFPDFKAKTPLVSSKGRTAELNFAVNENQTGTYAYFCTQPGHRQAGQEGRLIVGESQEAE
jgi:nitrite reductase (NO-forming)